MDVAKVDDKFHISSIMFVRPKTVEAKRAFVEYIRKHNINTVINVSDFTSNRNFLREAGIKNVLDLNFPDSILQWYQIPDRLENLIKIHETLSELNYKNILIHCTAGVNRSATVMTYLMKKMYNDDIEVIITRIREANKKQRGKPALLNYTFESMLKNHT